MSRSDTRLESAHDFRSRGWCPIPVRHLEKRPGFDGWQSFSVTEADLPQHFGGIGNIGILLGERSGGLVDVDLDSAEAVALAPDILPPTEGIFGRKGKRFSHWLYTCDPPPETKQFQFNKGMIVELRSTGLQTVFPPSVHESGEPIKWASEGEPAKIPAERLLQIVGDLAGLCLLIRNWPEPHGRYNVEGALIGALLRAGRSEDEVVGLIGIIQKHAGKPRITRPRRPCRGWPRCSPRGSRCRASSG
jgi:hypothetical protein